MSFDPQTQERTVEAPAQAEGRVQVPPIKDEDVTVAIYKGRAHTVCGAAADEIRRIVEPGRSRDVLPLVPKGDAPPAGDGRGLPNILRPPGWISGELGCTCERIEEAKGVLQGASASLSRRFDRDESMPAGELLAVGTLVDAVVADLERIEEDVQKPRKKLYRIGKGEIGLDGKPVDEDAPAETEQASTDESDETDPRPLATVERSGFDFAEHALRHCHAAIARNVGDDEAENMAGIGANELGSEANAVLEMAGKLDAMAETATA